jgi:hypothetical protein
MKTNCIRFLKEAVSIKLTAVLTSIKAGIPETYWYGVEGDYKCMVMELLG